MVRQKDGRRNRYQIQAHLPLPEAGTGGLAIGEILALLAGTRPAITGRPGRGTPDARGPGDNAGRGRSQEPGTSGNLIRRLEASFSGPEGRMTLRWTAQPGPRHPGIAGDADEGQAMAGESAPFRHDLNYGYIFLEIYC